MKVFVCLTCAFRAVSKATTVLGFMCVLLAVGCGEAGNRVSGSVTFDGKPVPAGKVYFKPDGDAGNSGAMGYADIVDGRYDTAAPGARNVGTGPMIVSVEGIDHQAPPGDGEDAEVTAKVLFLGYEIRQEVGSGDITLDIAVPADFSLPESSEPTEYISP